MWQAIRTLKSPQRIRIGVSGQVQGVGFRPFVHGLARSLGLNGWVRNDPAGVSIEVQGDIRFLAEFERRLRLEAPPSARVDGIARQPIALQDDTDGFAILASDQAGAASTYITPDLAVCADCLAELFEPTDRRYRYPFVNCTHCGPRYTLTNRMPYDRPNTTMAQFTQCAACRREYEDPRDRRFHAQPNACPVCGPRLALHEADATRVGADDALAEAVQRIAAGQIVAIKGLGGFHLTCNADDPAAVARLRARKRRGSKPFAVMVLNAESVAGWARLSAAECGWLESPERPIVLVSTDAPQDSIAPHLGHVGVMLPYTPLQYLLFHEAAGRPSGCDWLQGKHSLRLIMTSANPGGEPLVRDNEDGFARLDGIADAFLVHDRGIAVRCDDSVIRVLDGAPMFLRRARGYTPRPLPLADVGPSVLAVGGWLKSTVCLTRGNQAHVSPYIGDLDTRAACVSHEEAIVHLLRMLDVTPAAVACDLHPDFPSGHVAARYAAERGIPLVTVQHHHAHAAAVAAEHALSAPFLAVTLDGTGYGSDGGAWGGELLRVDGASFRRLGHLRTLALPGGDRAAREPWRVAAGVLHELGRGEESARRWPEQDHALARALFARPSPLPRTSSAGRWFDAAAALLGVCARNGYEAEAAMRLEALAASAPAMSAAVNGFALREDSSGMHVLDLLPLLADLADERDARRGAARFHATLAQALLEWVAQAAARERLADVVLAGGCFLNATLLTALRANLQARGLNVYAPLTVSPGDESISVGQAWVALHCLRAMHS